jgi:hypothetical protein
MQILSLNNYFHKSSIRRHDTQHNGTEHNNTQHNDTEDNDTEDNDTEHNDTQHNDTQHNDSKIGLFVTLSINMTQHECLGCQNAECRYAECRYAGLAPATNLHVTSGQSLHFWAI